MKRMKVLSLVTLFFFVASSMIGYDLPVQSVAFAAETEMIPGVGTEQQADKLLNLYFRRIDSFYGEGKIGEAKNELSKVYMIDPANPRAKEYENKLETFQRQSLSQKEADLAKREALLGAEKVLQERQEIRSAFDKMLAQREGDRDGIVKSYFDSTQESQIEFEKLEKMGLKKYKEELFREARQAERGDRYKLAVTKYKDILAIDPNDIRARSSLQEAELKVEEQMDEFLLQVEEIDDQKLIREVTKNAMGAEDYENAMAGKGFARSLREPKPSLEVPLADKLQIPVTADFRDVNLVSVLNFLSDYTGINIIPSQTLLTEESKVSVRFKNLPLESALKYILKGQGLTYRIEKDVIWVATMDEMENEELETRVFYLQKGSGVFSHFSQSLMGELGTTRATASVDGIKTIKDVIEESVSFPPGAKIIFDERLGVLIVTNTPSNLKKIEEILHIIDEPPQQILIESRFIEVDLEDNNSLGLDFSLDSDYKIGTKNGANKYGILSGAGWDWEGVGTGTPIGGGSALEFAGVLTDPAFSVVLNAINNSTKTKTLSSPKITTVNNQTATIKVVTEEVFPTSFEVSLIQQDLNGDGDLDDAGETEFANVPQEFVSRETGVMLMVTPSVGMDHETITMSIIPEVSTVADEPAKFVSTSFDADGNEVSQGSGTPNIPRFTTSTLSTTVVLKSGETAVLGGLIRESRGQTTEKLPIIGDIPVIGKLFQSNQDTTNRRNLIIFITGKVLN
ncbi:MAG: secretin and TonB N-terminal domain-containing protein [Candidatus Omnitrophica bacterium]|nr:secretin and TonB N-terminal domain-containing protein [Candidatus Omnitrophota bacterium]